MKLYHGSLEIVKNPEIRDSDRNLDYGKGFYTTTSYEQTLSWVKRKQKEYKKNTGYINEYEFNEESAKKLKILVFENPTDEWIDFVMKNRLQKNYDHNYDIVFGPVANDRVFAAFSLFESEIIDKETLIAQLRVYALVDQYLFHTEESLKTLDFVKTEEINGPES